MSTLLQSSPTSQVALKEHTTLRIGGVAEQFRRPDSRVALLETLDECKRVGIPFRMLGRGSNVFVSDEGVAGMVIRNTDACRELEFNGPFVKVGSSVPLQKLLNEAAKRQLGGIEYLYSVPGNLGGAVFMNAGRGKQHANSISDVLVSVEAYRSGELATFTVDQCQFAYRSSIFQVLSDVVILSAVLKLIPAPEGEIRSRINKRIELVRDTQDTGFPNAGTVFKSGFALKRELMGVSRGGAKFSEKTSNWIVQDGSATSADVAKLLDLASTMHLERRLPLPELEWIVWE